MFDWTTRKALVTGGASFIGSHLVDMLLEKGAAVRIVDDLSSGHLDNIRTHLDSGAVEFIEADLRQPGVARKVVDGIDVVFHLAADHGGRGYVDLHQAATATNLALDGMLFLACRDAGVRRGRRVRGRPGPRHYECLAQQWGSGAPSFHGLQGRYGDDEHRPGRR